MSRIVNTTFNEAKFMKFFLFLVFAYAAYNLYIEPNSTDNSTISAREIAPQCDVILFTTASCPYCKKAKNLMIGKGVKWCEKNIERSTQNRDLFKSLGGRGVPLAVIGDQIFKGFSKQKYLAALDQIEPTY